MDPLLAQVASQLAYKNSKPALDLGAATAANLSAGPAPTDPLMQPIPDVTLRDPSAALQYKPGDGKAGGTKNSKLDAILGMLGTGGELAMAFMNKEPEGKQPFNPIESSPGGAAPILGGTQGVSPLEKGAVQVSPYQSAIISLLGR